MTDLYSPMTQAEFGALIGVSRQAVGDMVARGVLSSGGSAAAWLHAYCGHLREIAAGRAAAGDIDLATERALLARAQRAKIEMQNAQARRELAPVILIEEVLAKAGSRVAGILDGIPGMIRRRVAALSADDLALIVLEIARARNIAAAVSLDDLMDESEPVCDEPPTIEDEAV